MAINIIGKPKEEEKVKTPVKRQKAKKARKTKSVKKTPVEKKDSNFLGI